MNLVYPALALGAFLLAAFSGKSKPALLTGVSVEGREYLVIRLQNGYRINRVQGSVVTGSVILEPGVPPQKFGADTDILLEDSLKVNLPTSKKMSFDGRVPSLMARTSVEGREYLIVRLKSGFEVSRVQGNVVTGTITFKPGGKPTAYGKDETIILSDMNKFPVNVMK